LTTHGRWLCFILSIRARLLLLVPQLVPMRVVIDKIVNNIFTAISANFINQGNIDRESEYVHRILISAF